MSTSRPASSPEWVALLPDREAVKHLTDAVLQGDEDMPQAALAKVEEPLGKEPRFATVPIRELLDEGMRRFAEDPVQADAWLASRLHATLRLTRREAPGPALWNFLALRLAPDFVFWRWKRGNKPANRQRFCGPSHTQAFSRLWWAGELYRNGADYRPVEIACRNPESFHTILRMEIVQHRATAQAIVRLLERGVLDETREMVALAQAINAAGATLSYEVLACDESHDADAYRSWMDDAVSAYVPYDSLPEGPDDGRVPETSVDALTPLFEKLFLEAPVRGRKQEAQTEYPDAGV